MSLFNKKPKELLKYKIGGNEVVFADDIKLNEITGQTILYLSGKIIYVIPKEISVHQTQDQTSCARSAQVLNYDIKNTLKRIKEKENHNETDELMIRFLYKMEEYLKYVSGDLYQDYYPKDISHIYS